MTQALLSQAIDAIRRGDKASGQALLAQVLRADPRSETAWLWMSQIVETDAQRIDCLRRILSINPNHSAARRGIELLEAQQADASPQAPPAPAVAEKAPDSFDFTSEDTPLQTEAAQEDEFPSEDIPAALPILEDTIPEEETFDFASDATTETESEPEELSDVFEFPPEDIPSALSILEDTTPDEETFEFAPADVPSAEPATTETAPEELSDAFDFPPEEIPAVESAVVETDPEEGQGQRLADALEFPSTEIPAAEDAEEQSAIDLPAEEEADESGRRPRIRLGSIVRILMLLLVAGIAAVAIVVLTSQPGEQPDTPVVAPQIGRLAVAIERDGASEIVLMRSDGTGLTPLLDRAGAQLDAAWSPDGQRLAFASDESGTFEIVVVDANGQGFRQLTTSGAQNLEPAWTPDGTRIAFASNREGDFDILVMSDDGGAPFNLTRFKGDDHAPAWTPDGQSIIFQSDRDGQADIYRMNADGSNATALTRNPADDTDPVISPDGTQIAFVASRNRDTDIMVMDIDGSNLNAITDNDVDDKAPAWTPDGSIMFVSDLEDGAVLFIVDSDGSNARRVVDNALAAVWQPVDVDPASITTTAPPAATEALQVAAPSTQPAGRIYFAANPDDQFDLYVMNSDGANRQQLTSTREDETHPSIAFVAGRIAYSIPISIYIANLDGSQPVTLAQTDGTARHPVWSPDETKIAFELDGNNGSDIAVVDLQNGNTWRSTNQTGFDGCLSWRADGTKIAFSSARGGDFDIYTMEFNGQQVERLTRHRADDRCAAWHPDGTSIAFLSSRNGEGVYLMSTDGSNARLLAAVQNATQPIWSRDGKFLLVSSDQDGSYDIYLISIDDSAMWNITNTPDVDEIDPVWGP